MFKAGFYVTMALAFLSSAAHAEKMTFRTASTGGNCQTCTWTSAEGEITNDTPSDFQKFSAEFGPVRNLVLNSPGGDLIAGMKLGRILREQNTSTIVGTTITGGDPDYPSYSKIIEGHCYSACSYTFFGGVDRHVNAGDLGVHQFYPTSGDDLSSSNTQTVVGVELSYVKEMGINVEALVSANMTTPDQIYTYSEAELARFNIDNTPRETDNGWFMWLLGPSATIDASDVLDPHWALTPYQGGLMLAGGIELGAKRSVALTIFCRNGGAPSNLLMQERGEISKFADALKIRSPLLTIADTTYRLEEADIDFQGLNQGTAMISLNLPVDILLKGAERPFAFEPQLENIYYPLLTINARMPRQDLIISALNNCIIVD